MGLNNVTIRNSIGVKLLKQVFGVYCIVALLVTGYQIWLEYSSAEEDIRADMQNHEPFVNSSLANAVWHMDMDNLGSILPELIKNDTIIGVSVRSGEDQLIAQSGTVAKRELAWPVMEFGLSVTGPQIPTGSDLFWYEFPLYDPNGLSQEPIGWVAFYSDQRAIWSQIEADMISIVLAALFKTLALWCIFIVFGQRLLSRPLATMVSTVRELPLDALPDQPNEPKQGLNELELLSHALSGMQEKLRWTLAELNGANKLLSESNLNLQRAAEQSPASITIFTSAGEVLYTNPAFELITGFSRAEAQYAYDNHLYKTMPIKQRIKVLLDSETPESTWSDAVENQTKRGSTYWSETLLAPVRDKNDEIRHFVSITSDISARKQAEVALQQKSQEQQETSKKLNEATQQLLQSEKMASIGQLAAGVAHEINNPVGYVNSNLVSLAGYAEDMKSLIEVYDGLMLENDGSQRMLASKKAKDAISYDFLKDDISDLLEESKEGVVRVMQIIQNLKDFSHVDKGEWVLSDLHQGLDSTLNVVNNELKYKADIQKAYGNLPQVRCMPAQINQVFMNLLVNAAHAIEGRGVIRIASGVEGERVWIDISDTGAGISPDNLSRLFEPFFTTKPVGKGTGLGLSVSFGIIKKHHGEIEVDSQPGKGSRFRIWLPKEQAIPEVSEPPPG